MSLGELLTYGGMEEGNEVSWMPSYGPEMRAARLCGVIVSDEPVGSPVVTEPNCSLAMNLPSWILLRRVWYPAESFWSIVL